MRRPKDPNPLFPIVEGSVVIKGLSPMERQRREDGTPHTVTGTMCHRPQGPSLYMEGYEVSKSLETSEPAEGPSPASIVKSYLIAKGVATPADFQAEEDEEKGFGSAVAKVGSAVAKQGMSTAAGLASKQ